MKNPFWSPRFRLAAALVGLALVLIALAALGFALWPLEPLREQAPLAPTLFIQP